MGKVLRFIAILFLSISALFNIAGGAGTTCVAVAPTKWPAFEGIARMQALYILYVVVTLGFGVMMVRGVTLLVKGRSNGYRYALISLLGGIAVGILHIATSRALRESGSSMPVDGVVYTTVLTLVIFLVLRLPGVWQKVNFSRASGAERDITGGAAAIVCGLLSLAIPTLVASTHTIAGVNYGAAFQLTTTGVGCGLLLVGVGMVWKARRDRRAVHYGITQAG